MNLTSLRFDCWLLVTGEISLSDELSAEKSVFEEEIQLDMPPSKVLSSTPKRGSNNAGFRSGDSTSDIVFPLSPLQLQKSPIIDAVSKLTMPVCQMMCC